MYGAWYTQGVLYLYSMQGTRWNAVAHIFPVRGSAFSHYFTEIRVKRSLLCGL